MGQPRIRKNRKYDSPRKPYEKSRLEDETRIKKQFGLRRKQELWRMENILREFRRRGRELLANPNEDVQRELFQRLNRIGVNVTTIDDVLSLKLEYFMNRRLQTVVWKRGLAKTAKQARQYIVHKNVKVNGRVMRWPSYMVRAEEEDKIELVPHLKSTIIAAEEAEGAKP